ncbi:MAG: glycosyltransferase [Acidobacteria bacterium]|nr:glycosyltransferase [Acidobacteriota bacterium]MDW7985128.1 glycosyltransferase [Acidobacteriota bacterium]
MTRPIRVLLVSSHPVPNQTAVLRLLATRPEVNPLVAYCSLPSEARGQNPEFLTKQAFDVCLLDGYSWTYVPNRSLQPGLDRFFGLWNPGLVRLIRQHDCVVVYGYAYASLALAVITAKSMNRALILGTDVTSLASPSPRRWRTWLKPGFYRRIFRLPDVVIVPSTAAFRFLCSLGLPPQRVIITPYVVDNDWITDQASRIDPIEVRRKWGIPPQAPTALVCAKFLPRKRLSDVVQAFAMACIQDSYLVMVGDGPLRESLVAECERLGISQRVRFLGLIPYSALPAVYTSSDVLVVASEHEPWGLPVNEAMLCGTPVIVSDRVGAGYDLVREGETGFVYPCGDVKALTYILREVLPDRERLRRMGEAARKRMKTWSPRENVEALLQAVEKAIALKGKKEPTVYR